MDEEELKRLSESDELTEELVKEHLNAYAKALRQEFEDKTAEEPEQVELHTRNFFKKNVHSAAAQVVWLSGNAESETVRLNASKYIVSVAIEAEKDSEDPVAEIIKHLQANAAES